MADERRHRLQRARLYLVADRHAVGDVLARALEGGVDMFQLRDKDASGDELLAAAREAGAQCAAAGALFFVNDDPQLAAACGADGVHVGQDDMPVTQAREIVGPQRLVGLSTHAPEQLDAAGGADYVAVGPVYETPTKPGRVATGLEYVRHAAAHARVPWFAIGGIDAGNLGDVTGAGARRIVVVRAIAGAADPHAAARTLRDALEAAGGVEEAVHGAA